MNAISTQTHFRRNAAVNAGLQADASLSARADDTDPFRAIGRTVSLAKGALVFEEGDEAEAYFRVVSGSIRLYRMTEDGKRQIIAFLQPGQFFGLEMNECHGFSADALSNSTVQRLPRTQVASLLRENSASGDFLFGMLRDQLTATQERLVLGRRCARARVASFLIALTRRNGRTGAERNLHLTMSRSDIADFLGLAVETVSRVIGDLKEKSVIGLTSPQHISVRDFDALVEMSSRDAEIALA